jgi:hypothetical protein
LALALAPGFAGYKARPWSPRPVDSYPARLTSEGVTIAAEPLFRDDLAAQVFDKDDMVTRGIMPLAIVIFNDNDFPVRIEVNQVEIIEGDEHVHTLQPVEVVSRIYKKGKKNVWIPQPIPRVPAGDGVNADALSDIEYKFLGSKHVEPHDKGGGFIYIHPPPGQDISAYLSKSRVYIPDVFRGDTGTRMIFFEIELAPAMDKPPVPQH